MKIKLLHKTVKVPARQTPGAAGFDICAHLDGPIHIHPGRSVQFNTGFALEIPEGFVGLILPRSSLGVKSDVYIANTVPVIDSDYRGEVLIFLGTRRVEPVTIFPGDRIAQLVLVPVSTPELEVVDELSSTERGEGGFGSTGV